VDGEPIVMHDGPGQPPRPSRRAGCRERDSRKRRAADREELLVCRPLADGIRALHLSHPHGQSRWRLFDVKGDDLGPLPQMVKSPKCRVVCVLPKSQYLVRTIELPDTRRAEKDQMLALEVEAMLPDDYGPAEVAYLDLPSPKPGRTRCEVYIARRQDLGCWVRLWQSAPLARSPIGGLSRSERLPMVVLPSSVVWRQVLGEVGDTDLLVVRPESGAGELAFMDGEQSLAVRTVAWNQQNAKNGELPPELAECLRTALAQRREGHAPLVVGWVGRALAGEAVDDRLIFRDLGERFGPSEENGTCPWRDEPVLWAAAKAARAGESFSRAQSGSLLPHELLVERNRRSLRRCMAVAAGCILLALVLSHASFTLLAWRCGRRSDELSGKIAMIRTEGEATGRKLRQIEAVAAARGTRNDFSRVLAGLYDATPPGMTYNKVLLDEEGQISLDGQAPSLALPFLLPERLEAQPVFTNVVPRGAGQIRKDGGTIAEFRVDCRIERAGVGR